MPLRLLQPNRTVTGMNRQQIPAPVNLSMNVLLAETPVDGYRNVSFNMPIAGVQIHISGKISGQFQGHAPVPGPQIPTRCHSRTSKRPGLNAAVPSAKLEDIETSGSSNAPIPSACPQRAIHRLNFLMAVASLQLHLAFEIRQPDGTVSGMEVDFPFARHVDINVEAIMEVEVNDVNVVGVMDFQRD